MYEYLNIEKYVSILYYLIVISFIILFVVNDI